MKLRTIDPNQILTIVISVMLFAIGVYAVFAMVGSMPNTAPTDSSKLKSGIGQLLYPGATAGPLSNNDTAGTDEYLYISCPYITSSYYNSTVLFLIESYWNHGTYASAWATGQAVGSANGTIMSNNTYRVTGGTFKAHNDSVRVTYYYVDPIYKQIYQTKNNQTSVYNNVFNVVGIVLIIGAVLAIVGIVYGYLGKGRKY